MKIHEYQAKQIMKMYGINVPNGSPAFSPEEAARIAKDFDAPIAVVKAQIHAGGRGKAGGVKLAHNLTHSVILNFIELSQDCCIVEIKTPALWHGKTIRELDVRNKYKVNIIAIRDDSTGRINVSHGAEYVLRESDSLLILGEDEYVDAIYAL